MVNSFKKGMLVMSTQGYDKGKFYIVKEITGQYAYLINGKERHFNKPKKKNLKHIKPFSLVCVLDEKNIARTDNEVYKLIKMFKKAINKIQEA